MRDTCNQAKSMCIIHSLDYGRWNFSGRLLFFCPYF